MFIWLIRGRPNIFAFPAHLYQKNIRRKLPPGLVGYAWHIIITYQDCARFEEWRPKSVHGCVCVCVCMAGIVIVIKHFITYSK